MQNAGVGAAVGSAWNSWTVPLSRINPKAPFASASIGVLNQPSYALRLKLVPSLQRYWSLHSSLWQVSDPKRSKPRIIFIWMLSSLGSGKYSAGEISLKYVHIYFSPEGEARGRRYLHIALRKKIPVRLFVCLSVNMSITPKRLEIDPTYGVSLDHKFHEECHRHNFSLAGWLQNFAFIIFFCFFRLKFWARRALTMDPKGVPC